MGPFLRSNFTSRCFDRSTHVTVAVLGLDLPGVVESFVVRAPDDRGSFGLEFLMESGEVTHANINVPGSSGYTLRLGRTNPETTCWLNEI